MRRIRLFPLLLTLILLLSATPTATAEPLLIAPNPFAPLLPSVRTYENQLTDATDAWCADAIKTVYETGLMEGKTADRFDYTSPLTYAQITVITARLHELLNGGDGQFPAPAAGEAWFVPALNYLRSIDRKADTADLLLDNMTLWVGDPTLPNRPCPRKDFALMLLSILPELPVLNETAAAPDVAAAHPIQTLYRAGIVGGSDDYGTFYGESSLTRGAAAAILSRIADPAQRLRLDLAAFDVCRDVLGIEPDTVLLTMDGEDISAEVFAYACVESGYLQNVGDAPPWSADTIEQGVLDCLRAFGAYALLAKDLPEETMPDAKTLAGTGGISEAGWASILKIEGDIAAVKRHYETLYPVSGPHFFYEQTPEAHIRAALKDVKTQVSLEPSPALASINWGEVYMRSLRTPCNGDYSLNPAFLTK